MTKKEAYTNLMKKIPSRILLADLRSYRRGTNYDKSSMKAIVKEVEYRKKIGVIKSTAKTSLVQKRKGTNDFDFNYIP